MGGMEGMPNGAGQELVSVLKLSRPAVVMGSPTASCTQEIARTPREFKHHSSMVLQISVAAIQSTWTAAVVCFL